jgi:hypothetical protein
MFGDGSGICLETHRGGFGKLLKRCLFSQLLYDKLDNGE